MRKNKLLNFIKYGILASLITCSFCFVPKITPVYAESSEFETIVTNDSDSSYIDISNLTSFAIKDDNVYYTTDVINIYDTNTDKNTTLDIQSGNIEVVGQYTMALVDGKIVILGADNVATQINAIANDVEYTNFDTYYNGNHYLLASYTSNDHINIAYYELSNILNRITYATFDITNELFESHGISEIVSLACGNGKGYVLFKDSSSTLRSASFSTMSGMITWNNNTVLNDVKYFDYVTIDNESYLVAFSSNNNVVFVDDNGDQIVYNASTSESYELGKIHTPQCIAMSNSNIYIADSYYHNISSYELKNNALSPLATIMASKGSDIDRYNNVSNLYAYDKDNIYVVDSGNSRIKQIKNDKDITVLSSQNEDDKSTFLYMQDILFDSNNSMMILRSNQAKSNSYIIDYSTKTQYDLQAFAYSFTVDDNDKIYYTTADGLYQFDTKSSTLLFSNTNLTGKSLYKLYGLDTFVSFNGTNIILIDSNGEKQIDTLDIICDIVIDMENNIYVLHDSNIEKYSKEQDNYQKVNSVNTDCVYSNLALTITSAEMYLFDNINSRLVKYVNFDFATTPQLNNDYTHDIVLPSSVTTYQCNNDTNCFALPYNIGTAISLDQGTLLYVVDKNTYPNYSQIIYYKNGIKTGFVKSDSLSIVDATTSNLNSYKAIDNSKIYKYPVVGSTILGSIAKGFQYDVTKSIQGIDGKTYYQIYYNDGVAYIIASDFLQADSTEIAPLVMPNAKIICNDDDYINLYDISGENILATLRSNDRIYVPKYDKAQDKTFVIVVQNNKEISGYITTGNIKMDEISMYEIFAIVDIAISVFALVILCAVIIKRRKKENGEI